MFVRIYCSRCGNRRRLSTKGGSEDALAAIRAGWGSCGNALYCPKCTKTWNERNSKPMAGTVNTLANIGDVMIRSLEYAKQED